MNSVQVTSLLVEALQPSDGKKNNTQEEVMAEQEGPRAAWLPATPS